MEHKKYIYKAIILVGIIALMAGISSCEDFLDLKPLSFDNVDNFYKSETDFEQAVNATYNRFRSAYAMHYIFGDLRADNTTMVGPGQIDDTPEYKWIDVFDNLHASNYRLAPHWPSTYRVIQAANGILDNIEKVDFNQARKDQFKGEALTFRAMSYFRLARMWGGVPIVLNADVNIDESFSTPRASLDDVYKLIIDDLTNAIPLLPVSYSGNDIGRISRGTARTLLGQVYLTRHNFSGAAEQFGEVINSNVYSLLPNYEDNFAPGAGGNKEAIWQLLYNAGHNQGSTFPRWMAPRNSSGIVVEPGSTFAFNQPSMELINAYEEGDLRKDVSIGMGFTNLQGNWVLAPYIKLYTQHEMKTGGSDCHFNIFRYGHLLLMQAEALNETNNGPNAQAYAYVNQIRQRAGLPDLPAGLSQSQFRDAVYREQRFEVAFEGHRWFDLLRTGRALEVMNSKVTFDEMETVGPYRPVQEYELLFPIPQDVIDRSHPGVIKQNPGW